MSTELRTGRGGKLRSTWYGRYEVKGKRYTINLGVKVSGMPPKSRSLRDEGDKAFERSRTQANERLKPDHRGGQTKTRLSSPGRADLRDQNGRGDQVRCLG